MKDKNKNLLLVIHAKLHYFTIKAEKNIFVIIKAPKSGQFRKINIFFFKEKKRGT